MVFFDKKNAPPSDGAKDIYSTHRFLEHEYNLRPITRRKVVYHNLFR